MPNVDYSKILDPRLQEMAQHRLDAAIELAKALRGLRDARDAHARAWAAHQKTCNDYESLEMQIAGGSTPGSRLPRKAVAS